MITISKPYAPMLIAAVRDAVIYQEGLLRSQTLRDRADHEEHYMHLTQFFEYVQKEYKRHEEEIGCPLENLV